MKGYKYILLNNREKREPMSITKQTTYLGAKGYTISKKELTIEEQKKIRADLTIQPFVMGSPMNNNRPSFHVYRESENKMYVPHYYGVEQFGEPKQNKLCEGNDILVEFQGSLRDYQVPVVETYLKHVTGSGSGSGSKGGLLELPCAFGKTCLALYILSKLKKKTFIIVHKEFLMNQWIERIQQFLPNARIGKIQGQIIDIDDKDIVLGMLQSLSLKDYPSTLFESFGFTVIDEVHHISSEVFSNTLFKVVTKYMLGLSATMNRKDGTTHVFKMFLGGVIFKGKRDEGREVTVRAIEYKVKDDEFNEVHTDFRGNPAYSKMIGKLCEYNRRSDFILKVMTDMFQENPTQQIMVLAHNKNILTYLHNAIAHKNIATVGYYVGGMKEHALKETESKQVVIATYSMASEALDIKTLTTLIMATPKTDIEQSVGRILREKHSQPIVVDIVDSHDLFKNQWRKRKTFYKKENYKILYTTSLKYTPDTRLWDIVFQPHTNTNTSCVFYKKTGKTMVSEDEDDDVSNENKDKLLQGVCFLTRKG